MKKNKILIILIIFFIVFLISITIYKSIYRDNSSNNRSSKPSMPLQEIKLLNNKKELVYDTVLDEEKYKDYIIEEIVEVIPYSYLTDEKSITGEIYLDKNNLLHISNEIDKEDKIISDIKFKTLYLLDSNDYNGIYIYLISLTNKLYYFALHDNELKDMDIKPISTRYPVMNFTNISYENDISPSGSTLFVLEQDGNIYEIASDTRYHENIKLLFDSLLVYDDNTVANIYAKVYRNSEGKEFKAKYLLNAEASDFIRMPTMIMITEDNEVVFISQVDYNYEYIYYSKLKDIKYESNYPFTSSKLNLTFENNNSLEFSAYCSLWYCPNELKLD